MGRRPPEKFIEILCLCRCILLFRTCWRCIEKKFLTCHTDTYTSIRHPFRSFDEANVPSSTNTTPASQPASFILGLVWSQVSFQCCWRRIRRRRRRISWSMYRAGEYSILSKNLCRSLFLSKTARSGICSSGEVPVPIIYRVPMDEARFWRKSSSSIHTQTLERRLTVWYSLGLHSIRR